MPGDGTGSHNPASMAAKHKKNTHAHACATTTAPAIQSNDCATFRNISAHTTARDQNCQPRYTLKYLQTAPNSRSQTAPNGRRCLTRISINYGLTVGITLYPAILRFGGRDCGDSPPMTVCALRHTTIWAYADMRLETYNDVVIGA